MHLSLTTKKGLQKLDDDDFRDHHLYELLREHGPAERIGEDVFHDRLATIQLRTPRGSWPAGRRTTTRRPRRPWPPAISP